jgi:hypothetical protein
MKQVLILFALTILITACKSDSKSESDEWIHLFDGTTTDGWRAYNGESLPAQWVIKDGALTFDTEVKLESEKEGGKNIIYAKEEFDNFELYLEWKLPEGGNSGVFYHLKEGYNALEEIGPEYQLLDDLGWEARKNKGKWKDYPDYGTSKTGYIGLQDHDSPLWFKNIKIKKLNEAHE